MMLKMTTFASFNAMLGYEISTKKVRIVREEEKRFYHAHDLSTIKIPVLQRLVEI